MIAIVAVKCHKILMPASTEQQLPILGGMACDGFRVRVGVGSLWHRAFVCNSGSVAARFSFLATVE